MISKNRFVGTVLKLLSPWNMVETFMGERGLGPQPPRQALNSVSPGYWLAECARAAFSSPAQGHVTTQIIIFSCRKVNTAPVTFINKRYEK